MLHVRKNEISLRQWSVCTAHLRTLEGTLPATGVPLSPTEGRRAIQTALFKSKEVSRKFVFRSMYFFHGSVHDKRFVQMFTHQQYTNIFANQYLCLI